MTPEPDITCPKIDEVQSMLASARSDLDDQLSSVEQELEELRDSNSQLRSRCRDLEDLVDERENERDSLRDSLDQALERISQLEACFDQDDTLNLFPTLPEGSMGDSMGDSA